MQVLPMVNPSCPWLPEVDEVLDFTRTRRHGANKGVVFYQDALAYAQSQWRVGKPAQAVLQIDKALMADLSGDQWRQQAGVDPYRALVWIMAQAEAGECGYLGNPVRHFQHLASRMSGPRSELRSWRAWACFHLAERVLCRAAHPRDGHQIVREGLWIPGVTRAWAALEAIGWADEVGVVRRLYGG